jgi:hypothetical protein
MVESIHTTEARADDYDIVVLDRSASFWLLWVLIYVCHGVQSFMTHD